MAATNDDDDDVGCSSKYTRDTVVRQLYDKSVLIMESMERSMLSVYDFADGGGGDVVDRQSPDEMARRQFLQILRQQHRLRDELRQLADDYVNGGAEQVCSHTKRLVDRIGLKLRKLTDEQLARLLSYLNDLYTQVQPLLPRAGDDDAAAAASSPPDDHDDDCWTAARDREIDTLAAGAGDSRLEFTLLGEVYSTVMNMLYLS